jgi:hypothetical protein
MDANTILQFLGPAIDDAVQRLRNRTKADGRDVRMCLTPAMDCAARLAGGGQSIATERLASWAPADVTTDALHTLVQDMVTAATPAIDWAAIRARQAGLDAELAQVRGTDRPNISCE